MRRTICGKSSLPQPSMRYAKAIRRASVAQYGVLLELQAFEETRTVHDGRRLAKALRHVIDRPDLARMVSDLIGD